jgi:hypothetical protein
LGAPPPPKQEEQKQPQEQTLEQQEEKQQPEAKQGEQQEQEQQQQPQQHDADGDTAMDEGTAGAPSADAAPGEPQGEQQDAKPKRAAKPPHPTYDDAHTVFVRGMGREVTEADLRQLFADVPGLKDIRLALDRYDKSPRVRSARAAAWSGRGRPEAPRCSGASRCTQPALPAQPPHVPAPSSGRATCWWVYAACFATGSA